MLSLKPRNPLLTLAAVTVNWTTSWVTTSPFLSLWAVVVRVLSSAKGRVQSQLHSTFSEAEGDTVCKHARQKVPGVREAGDRKIGREGEWRRGRTGERGHLLPGSCCILWLFLNQVIQGWGTPWAWQSKVAEPLMGTLESLRFRSRCGASWSSEEKEGAVVTLIAQTDWHFNRDRNHPRRP